MATFNLTIIPITGVSTQPDDDDYKLAFSENIQTGRVIGVLSGFQSTADRDNANFVPVTSNGNPGDDGERFDVIKANSAGPGYNVGDWIVVIKNGGENYFNYENNGGFANLFTCSSPGPNIYNVSIDVVVQDTNEAPKNILLTGGPVASGNPGASVGALSAVDEDDVFSHETGETQVTYSIDAGRNGDLFTISGGTLRLKAGVSLDYNSAPNSDQNGRFYEVIVRATDGGGYDTDTGAQIPATAMSSTQIIKVYVAAPVNTAPTDIALSASTVAEDRTSGHAIGTLSATDAQGGAMTYTIVTDADSKFEIVGNELRVRAGASFDFENDTAHDVRIRVTDSGGLTYEKTLTVTVTNVNERPTDIGLLGTSVASTAGGGTRVGDLSFTDPDAGATGTYSILTNPNNYFQIGTVGGVTQLQIRNGANLTVGTYDVTVRVTDQGGLTRDETFTITVTNANTAPLILGAPNPVVKTTSDTSNIQAFSNVEIQDAGSLVVIVRMDNPAKGSFIGNGGIYDQGAGTFRIEGTANQVTAALNALQFNARDKAAGSAAEVTTFTITVTDSEGLSAPNSNISVSATAPTAQPQNQAPRDISILSGGVVDELSGMGASVATLGATDPDDTGGFVYSIVNPDGRFVISDNQIAVANGVMIDFEQKTSHIVRVRVTDKSGTGRSYEEDITITVNDKNPETMSAANASPLNDVIKGSKIGNFKDTFFGGAGDDKLWGGYGNDTLWGGAGKDVFVFDGRLGTASTDKRVNYDKIQDYSVKDDSIWLDNDLFKSNKKLYAAIKKGTETGPLKMAAKFFTVGDKAKQADDYFVYDAKKRVLYYDADGSGSKAAIEMANFTNNKALKSFGYKEFFFI